MMKRRLAPSLVVTLSAAACNTGSTKTSTVATADPTPTTTLDAAPPTPSSAPSTTPSAAPRKRTPHPPKEKTKSASWDGDRTPLNPTDKEHGEIYVGWDGTTCFVRMPFPEGTKLTSWQPSPTKVVDCPPSMDDAAWDQCRGGSIGKDKTTSVCVCTMDGNPPPPPAEVDCPK